MTDDTPPSPRPPVASPRTKPKPKSARRRSRELALQGIYHWLLNHDDAGVVDAHVREQTEFGKCDLAHYHALLHGCIEQASDLDRVIINHVDRKLAELSPVEHGTLYIGVYELTHCLDIPYRVVINEAVELAKVFGGTDGHKYVNGVLDKAATEVRPQEVQTYKNRPAR